ncbi:MAG: hypothetical protein AAGG72_06325, partial [Pseudomonadota bacterium]
VSAANAEMAGRSTTSGSDTSRVAAADCIGSCFLALCPADGLAGGLRCETADLRANGCPLFLSYP